MGVENNGLVSLQGGVAKTKTYFIDDALFEKRCNHCNQIEGEEYNDICYGKGVNKYYSRKGYLADLRYYEKSAWNIKAPEEPPFHEFELLPPIKLKVPLSLRNQKYATYGFTKRFTESGLRIYTYQGERGWRCTPAELKKENYDSAAW